MLCEDLDSNSLGGDSFHTEQIMKSLDDTRKKISEVIANNIAIRGAAQGAPTGIPRGTICGRALSIRRT